MIAEKPSLDKRPRSRHRAEGASGTVFLLPVAWLALSLAVTFGFIRMEYATATEQLLREARQLHSHVLELQQSNLAVLSGFSALLSVSDRLDRQRVSQYARQMLALYPQIFMLEVIEKVPADRLAEFERRLGREWHPGFRVRTFNYEGGRNWEPLPDKAYYYPIVFMEPQSPGSEQVLGLDVDAVPFLRGIMMESKRSGRTAISPPFHLIEGDRALVMHRIALPDSARSALLVVKADALVSPHFLTGMEDLDLRLYHADYAAENPRGMLWEQRAAAAGPLESWLLPRHSLTLDKDDAEFPFQLAVDKQFRWQDWNIGFVSALILGQSAVFAALLVLAREHVGRERERRENVARLAYLASHDGLTDLPNRDLLLDRTEQAIKRAGRQQSRFALLFMDIDCFKQVNDHYGHDAGDQLLVALAHAVPAAVRAQDTVARLSGDEFVVLAEQLRSRAEAQQIADKLVAAVGATLSDDYRELGVGASVGIALYPDDGDGAHALLRLADADMYLRKRERKPAGFTA